MAENPLIHVPAALPVLGRINGLRRRVVGRLRSFDVMRWESVPYGTLDAQRCTTWQLDDLGPRDGWPAVLLLHGGGWTQGSREAWLALGPVLARRGVLAAAIDYRLAPAARWPAQLDDVQAALDFLQHQQVDAERIALWGGSAGGHLALMAACRWPEQVRAVVAFGAPTDLRLLAAEGAREVDDLLSPDQREEASPLLQAPPDLPPVLLVHGEKDRVVSVEHARRFQEAFPEAVTLDVVPDGDHGIRWPPLAAWQARRRALDWLLARLDPAPRGSKWRVRKGR